MLLTFAKSTSSPLSASLSERLLCLAVTFSWCTIYAALLPELAMSVLYKGTLAPSEHEHTTLLVCDNTL